MRFSIVVCTKNSERFVNECLLSLSRQKYKDFEVVVIDAYSEDGTIKIVERYKKKLKMRIYKQKPRGISAAMNGGIKKTKGEYVLIIHSDDSLNNDKVLKKIDKWLDKNEELDWAYGQIQAIEVDGKAVGIFPTRKIWQLANKEILKFFNFVPHQAVVMKKEVFDKYGYFDEEMKTKMDWEMWLRLADKTKFKYMDILVSNFRMHSGATSSGEKNKEMNLGFQAETQKKYLSQWEWWVASALNWFIAKMNRMYR